MSGALGERGRGEFPGARRGAGGSAPMGWLMYGVPSGSFRRCSLCFLAAKSTASSSRAASEPTPAASELIPAASEPIPAASELIPAASEPAASATEAAQAEAGPKCIYCAPGPGPPQPRGSRYSNVPSGARTSRPSSAPRPGGDAVAAALSARWSCRRRRRGEGQPRLRSTRRTTSVLTPKPSARRSKGHSSGSSRRRNLRERARSLGRSPGRSAGAARPAPRSPQLLHRLPGQGAVGGSAPPAQLPPQPLHPRRRPPPPRPAGNTRERPGRRTPRRAPAAPHLCVSSSAGSGASGSPGHAACARRGARARSGTARRARRSSPAMARNRPGDGRGRAGEAAPAGEAGFRRVLREAASGGLQRRRLCSGQGTSTSLRSRQG